MMEAKNRTARPYPLIKILLLLVFLGADPGAVYSQVSPVDTTGTSNLPKEDRQERLRPAGLAGQYDIGDMINDVLRPKKKLDPNRKRSGITVVPNIAANPTIGFQIGIKAVAGRILGRDSTTYMSVAATSASITTKGILYFYFTHNVFTEGNKWNLQGSLVASKSVTPDFGLGIGQGTNRSHEDLILVNPDRKAYVWNSQYYKFFEKVYRQIGNNFFVGGGIAFEIRRNLTNARKDSALTPYEIYNARYGFKNDHYQANGFLFNVEYITRDNPNRAYKGVYIDAGLRLNQTWIGSSRNALQLTFDFRKYVSLSARNPEHVIAFWSWGSGVVTGAVPFLELPGTGRDPSFRSGRGYTVGYFKSSQFFYSEAEYRFPITRNKLFSGVVFANAQTANDKVDTKLMQVWQPGAGAGLRILFNKHTRTNLCLDYAFGRYGSKGFFLNLNETF